MAKNETLATVSIGPLQGRIMMVEHYLDNLQSVTNTLGLEARTNFNQDEEDFVLGLLQLSKGQLDAAKKELVVLKEMILDAASMSAEGRAES